ncbi:hypothetical protein Leryth_010644 [Lithospermum erythrorhizon]|nr:hypothetical protein Leryth_010644 [Lithospermum erythrorhizon]
MCMEGDKKEGGITPILLGIEYVIIYQQEHGNTLTLEHLGGIDLELHQLNQRCE